MRRIFTSLTVLTCIYMHAFSQPGMPDLSFGTEGIVITDASQAGNFNRCLDVKALNDGSVLACGYAVLENALPTYAASVVKYTSSGLLDASFGDGGIANIYFSEERYFPAQLEVQSDNKIVVCGYKYSLSGAVITAFVFRLLENGMLDSSFSSDGYILPVPDSEYNLFNDLEIQQDGKIVVGGEISSVIQDEFLIVRLNTDGTLDNTFAGDGILSFDIMGTNTGNANSLAIQADGKIVIGGTCYFSNYDIAVIRLNTNGTPDISFGTGGKKIINLQDGENSEDGTSAIEILPDGKIVIGGISDQVDGDIDDFAFIKLNSDGSLDNTFGDAGIMIIDKCGLNIIYDIALQADGKILASGEKECFLNDAVLLRLDANGAIDSTFGDNGYASGNFTGVAYAVDIQADGKIIIGGDNFSNFTVAKFYSGNDACSNAPSGLFVTNLAANKAKLNWTADAGALKYKVQYRPSASFAWTTVNATTNAKLITGLAPNTTYKYRVRSQCSPTLTTGWSEVEEFTTLALKENVSGEWSMVNVYPNPSDGHFTIQLPVLNNEEEIFISIKNILGEEIYAENIYGEELSHEINLSKNIKGVYVLEIKTAHEGFTQQIIIE